MNTNQPVFFIVKQEQLGRDDLSTFLRRAIDRQFAEKEYYITKEEILERPTPYSKEPRKLRGFLINENNSIGHAIYFDVTEVKTVDWA